MATIIKSNGQKTSVTPHNSERGFRLDEMQKVVGGYIEIVNIPTAAKQHRIMVINENGKLERMPVNRRATKMFRDNRNYPCPDYIVGDVLIANLQNPGQESETIK